MRPLLSRCKISPASRRRITRWLVGSPIKDIERDLILETLIENGGNRTTSARCLGVSIRTLRNRIAHYSLHGEAVPSGTGNMAVAKKCDSEFRSDS
ncbi:helix-turn-helix domain-containing protein [Tardiphaga sp.]|uniref:helix-turn-helix domain-containing protein n=1 Tax=Tardiphaga sp. TaxID=1926292 RepID=UPI002625EAC5|nr:helix-turn-helix domain-containing protein [Tardiphaga sp.]